MKRFYERILLVEDEPDARADLKRIFTECLPDMEVIDVGNVAAAKQKIEDAKSENRKFTAAIFDLVLPLEEGDIAQSDVSLCGVFRQRMQVTFVIHITGKPDSDELLRHMAEAHVHPNDPCAEIIAKKGAWHNIVVDRVRRYVYNNHISSEVADLFGSTGVQIAYGRRLSEASSMQRRPSLTHHLAILRREIIQYWPYLDEASREQVRQVFEVQENDSEVKIYLM